MASPQAGTAQPTQHTHRADTSTLAVEPSSAQEQTGPAGQALQPQGSAAIGRIAGVGSPEIDATKQGLGAHVVANMATANSTPGGWFGVLTAGINYSYNYQFALNLTTMVAALDPAHPRTDVLDQTSLPYVNADGSINLPAAGVIIQGAKDALAASPIKKWDRQYEGGFADPRFLEKTGWNHWKPKPGIKASQAVKAWLKGPTISECLSTMIVILVDTYRAAIGDDEFDRRFGDGSDDRTQLILGADMVALDGLLQHDYSSPTDGTVGKRTVIPGDWCYFTNHPKYLLKHPGGAWQGENAICIGVVGGKQLFGGLGATEMTEDAMMDEMVQAYNAPRDEGDANALEDMKRGGSKVPDIYDPANNEFPDKITKADILSAPPYTLGNRTRKGGFAVGSIRRLDAGEIAQQRPVAPKATGGR